MNDGARGRTGPDGTKRNHQAVELVERLPTAEEYVELLRRVGWESPPVDVVVHPDAQGHGIGQAIMDALEALVTQRELGTRLDLVAAPDVVPFYRRLGYSPLPSDLMRKPL